MESGGGTKWNCFPIDCNCIIIIDHRVAEGAIRCGCSRSPRSLEKILLLGGGGFVGWLINQGLARALESPLLLYYYIVDDDLNNDDCGVETETVEGFLSFM